MQASAQHNPRPEAPSFVPSNLAFYDQHTFADPALATYGPHWSAPFNGPAVYKSTTAGGLEEYESGNSKRKRALQAPPTIDIESCRIAIPDINQLTNLVQVQSAMYEKAMEKILVLERSHNKLLEYCHSMVKWSQTVTTANIISSDTATDVTPDSGTEDAIHS